MHRILLCWSVFHLKFSFESYHQFTEKSSSECHCLANDEILNLYNFSGETRSLETLNATIKEGKAVRISASYFAEKSPVLSLQACYKNMTSNTDETDNTYSCIDLCTKENKESLSHVGIGNRKCHCFHNLSENAYDKQLDTQCDPVENVLNGKKLSKINILKVVEIGHTFEVSQKKPTLFQCIAAKKTEFTVNQTKKSTVTYDTYPCNISIKDISYICEYKKHQDSNVACKTHHGSDMPHCIKDVSWLEAATTCRRKEGKLATLTYNDPMTSIMVRDHLYWTGMFRYFSITEDTTKNIKGNVCFLARNDDKDWFFEPAVCTDCHCELKRVNDFFSVYVSQTGTVTSLTDVNRPATQATNILSTTDENDTPYVFVTSMVSVITILLIILGSFVALVRCRKSTNIASIRRRTKVTKNDISDNSTKSEAAGRIRMKTKSGSAAKSLDGEFRLTLGNYDIVQADTEPSSDATGVTTGESVYDKTSCKFRDKIILEKDQPNIYSLTNAAGGVLKSDDSIYNDSRSKATGNVAVGGEDDSFYDKTEILQQNENENVYSKTKVERNNEVAIADLDLYSHVNTPSAERYENSEVK